MKLSPHAQYVLKLWAPPLIAILAMVLLAQWVNWVRFLLFGHHLFWIAAFILLMNPVIETLSPSPVSKRVHRPSPQSSKRSRPRAGVLQRVAKPKPVSGFEGAAGRLARLRKQKEVVDRQIEKLTNKDKEK